MRLGNFLLVLLLILIAGITVLFNLPELSRLRPDLVSPELAPSASSALLPHPTIRNPSIARYDGTDGFVPLQAKARPGPTAPSQTDPCGGRSANTPLECVDPDFKLNYRNTASSAEVVNGALAEGHEETVYLKSNDHSGVCTGVLIAKRLVVTARHCLCKNVGVPGTRVRFGLEAESGGGKPPIKIIAARYYPQSATRQSVPGACSEPLNVSRNWIDRFGPDVALLLLESDAKVPFVSIASMNDVIKNSFVRVVGYGRTKLNDTLSTGIRMMARAPSVSPDCSRNTVKIPGTDRKIQDSDLYDCTKGAELVAGWMKEDTFRTVDGSDTCRGDSGGPAFVVPAAAAGNATSRSEAFRSRKYLLAAVTSRRVQINSQVMSDSGAECGLGGVYSLIGGDALKWMREQAKDWKVEIGR